VTGAVIAIAYAAAGSLLISIQAIRRFGRQGLWSLALLLAIGVALALTRHSISPSPADVGIGLFGAMCISIVVVTRGHIERFPDRSVLSDGHRAETNDADTQSVQIRSILLGLLLAAPVFWASWSKF